MASKQDDELEPLVISFLFDLQVRQFCSQYLESWMFQRTIHHQLVETLMGEFRNKQIDMNVLRLHMQVTYKDIYSDDWKIVEDIRGRYKGVVSEDMESVTRVLTSFIKNRIIMKGVDSYIKGDHNNADQWFVKGRSVTTVTPDPFIDPLQDGIIERLKEKDLPTGGKVIKSSFGIINSSLQYKGYKNGDLIMVVMMPKCGKSVHPNTPIIMVDGTIKLAKNIVTGDLLMGPDSVPRTVLGTHSDKEMMYEIVPNKGDPYTVNESHILSLIDTRYPSRNKINISVRDFLKESYNFRHRAKGWRTGVYFPKHLDSKPLVITPYFLGLWLGDGTSTQTHITNPDKEIHDYVHLYAKSLGLDMREQYKSGCSGLCIHGGGPNILLDEFRRYGLIDHTKTDIENDYLPFKGKHIPHRYKTGSFEERLDLLAGILDSDGYLRTNDRGHQSFDLTLKNEQLMDDIIFVARSLGFACYKKECEKDCQNGFVGTYFRCDIYGPLETIPTEVERKKAKPKDTRNRDHLVTGISVVKKGEGEYFGFELDRDGLFLLGDFTVTHNSTFMVQEAVHAADQGFKVAHMFFGDFSEFDGLCKFMSCNSGQLIGDVVGSPIQYRKKCESSLGNWRVAAFPAFALDCEEVVSYARNLRKTFPFDLLIIDYDSNVKPPKDAGMYESGGTMYSTFKGFGQSDGPVIMIGSQPKLQYWGQEVLGYNCAAESSRKQHVVDVMVTGGRNDKYKNIGTINLPLIRRGESAVMQKVKFDDYYSRILEISPGEYEHLLRQHVSGHQRDNKDSKPAGDIKLDTVEFKNASES